MPKQFTLGKNERLKSRKAIEELFNDGKRFTVSPFRVYYSINYSKNLQFCIGASVRNFKKAVDRNKVKRLVREAYRLQKNPLQTSLKEKGLGLDIFFIYSEKEIPDYTFVYSQIEKVLKKISVIVDENGV